MEFVYFELYHDVLSKKNEVDSMRRSETLTRPSKTLETDTPAEGNEQQ